MEDATVCVLKNTVCPNERTYSSLKQAEVAGSGSIKIFASANSSFYLHRPLSRPRLWLISDQKDDIMAGPWQLPATVPHNQSDHHIGRI